MASTTQRETPSYLLDPHHRFCVGKNTIIDCPECNGNLRNVCVLCRQKRIVRYPCWNCQPQEAVRQAMALGSAQVPAVKISGTNGK
ncbi:hypothetical protein I7I48_03109 [Histoplasma ohiense]|uniref:Uncharacterized protein n=1 Tax=Ajellomyces capsulatus TaxID=5037 RepID=A0A8H7YIV5_AJECA|nr:hypothetical protein I7I48_03109 [Histoplasma ohiense (nom. inval.)]KAG5290324.1 hypothetical protein I7I52_07318 [Histoplasma capsulatum]QSS72251.1 hypothetical protein I7I50_00049 [Histoplasma capsulatum G186AR]